MFEFAIFILGFVCGIAVIIIPFILVVCEAIKEKKQKKNNFDGQEWD